MWVSCLEDTRIVWLNDDDDEDDDNNGDGDNDNDNDGDDDNNAASHQCMSMTISAGLTIKPIRPAAHSYVTEYAPSRSMFDDTESAGTRRGSRLASSNR